MNYQHHIILPTHVLFALDERPLFLLGQLGRQAGPPLDIVDVLLEGVLGDDFADEVPDLVALLGAQQDEAAGGVHEEEAHAADHQVLLGELEGQGAPALLALPADQAQGELALLGTLLGGVVEGEEAAVACQDHPVLQVVPELAGLGDLDRLVPEEDVVEGDDEADIDPALGGLVLADDGEAVVVPVPADAVHLLTHLHAANLERLFLAQQVAHLYHRREVVLLYELPQRDRHPVTPLRHEDFPALRMLAPDTLPALLQNRLSGVNLKQVLRMALVKRIRLTMLWSDCMLGIYWQY
jgi:hypothetical protein